MGESAENGRIERVEHQGKSEAKSSSSSSSLSSYTYVSGSILNVGGRRDYFIQRHHFSRLTLFK